MSDPKVDFAKYLRTIQFALVSTSIALLAALNFGQDPIVSAAVSELEQVLALRAALGDQPAHTAFYALMPEEELYRECVEVQYPSHRQKYLLVGRLSTDQADPLKIEASLVTQSTSFEDFERAWNTLLVAPKLPGPVKVEYLLMRQSRAAETQDYERYPLQEVAMSECEWSEPSLLHWKAFAAGRELGYGYSGTLSRYVPEANWAVGMEAFLPVTHVEQVPTMILQQVLWEARKEMPDLSFSSEARAQPLIDAFPNLKHIVGGTDGLGSFSLDELGILLEAIRHETSADLELFGVSFPLEALTTWGLLILFGVQTYFLAHLRGAAALVPASFPWIALYQDRWRIAELTAFVSVCLLPALAASMLAARTLDTSSEAWLKTGVVALASISVALTVPTLLALWRLRRDAALAERGS